ncbi:hypothetical protein Q7C36_001242 [Tachysurus vachellii]|uniref:CxC1-like cysteine cluster associated with KDZ transposases domain-containing protein n=1 Tax=Tachysurus vachellii TaxID=175792 RepID=A0AA88P0M7_TACVA|nr:hypothetical protein Q7C36_001242 [Tachysurus vachellii]
MCACGPETCTLLRYGLWPATADKPQTAFSIPLLELFVCLSLECQVSVEGFCNTLRWKNNLTLAEVNTLHRALVGESIAHFRHHHFRQRSLVDVCSQFDDGTTCPACPKADGDMIVTLDANFGLVRKQSSGTSAVEPLHGTRMFVDEKDVEDYLLSHLDSSKPHEDCSNFKAGNVLRSQQQAKKLDVTGVFGASCRHEMPLMFVNMSQGERQQVDGGDNPPEQQQVDGGDNPPEQQQVDGGGDTPEQQQVDGGDTPEQQQVDGGDLPELEQEQHLPININAYATVKTTAEFLMSGSALFGNIAEMAISKETSVICLAAIIITVQLVLMGLLLFMALERSSADLRNSPGVRPPIMPEICHRVVNRKHKDTSQSVTPPEASCSQIQEDNFQSDTQSDEGENCEEPDMSATPADLEKTGNLPVTPRLILLGPSDTQGQWMKRWMISLEGLE